MSESGPLSSTDVIKTWNHAKRLFVDNNYALGPKQDFLYHVFFDVNTDVVGPAYKDNNRLTEVGMLVKAVQLPKYTIEVKKYNAYNRPNIIQNKLEYNEVTINFYDDHSDRIVGFWSDYMNYYFRDTDISNSDNISPYTHPHKYKTKELEWGYNIRNGNSKPYMQAIRIYSLHQKRFTEYTLINPVITQFRHGDHRNNGTEPLECEMTVAFETVLYNFGNVSKGKVKGFADLHYDKEPSPLAQAGGSKSFLGPGGLIQSGQAIFNDLSSGNILGAAVKIGRTIQNNKGANLKQIAKTEFGEFAKDILRNNNPLGKIAVPIPPNIIGTIGAAVVAKESIQLANKTSNGISKNPAKSTQKKSLPNNPPLNTNFGNPKTRSNSETLIPTTSPSSENLPLTTGPQPKISPTPQVINNKFNGRVS